MRKRKMSNTDNKPVEKVVLPTTDLSPYKDVVIPDDVQQAKDRIAAQYLSPYGLQFPAYVMKHFYLAALAPIEERHQHLERARQKAETHYLGQRAKGNIKTVADMGPPMPEDVKQKLKEINQQRREEKQEHTKSAKVVDTSTEKPKRSKTPVFQDPDAQKLVLTKYPWVVDGSFKQDPEKAGGTLVSIKCACGKLREIHLADAFQVKMCLECRAKK